MLSYWYQIYFYATDLEMYFWKLTFFSDIDQFALVYILNMCWTPLNINPIRTFLMSFYLSNQSKQHFSLISQFPQDIIKKENLQTKNNWRSLCKVNCWLVIKDKMNFVKRILLGTHFDKVAFNSIVCWFFFWLFCWRCNAFSETLKYLTSVNGKKIYPAFNFIF